MKLFALILLGVVLMLPAWVQARMIADVDVAEKITVAEQPLVLNGAGVRSKFFMDLYVGSLYLPTKANTLDDVLAQPIAVIQLTITSGMVTSDRMRDGITQGFETATGNDTHFIAKEILHFTELFSDNITKGDQFTFVTQKGKGVSSIVNGHVQGEIVGEAFRQALLSIWLGDESAQQSLRQAMLAQSIQ
ncbi:chalcone isomerase family protein [Shewanella sp. A14]